MNKESIDLYCTNKTDKILEAIRIDEELATMKKNLNYLIRDINSKILSVADSIYPGISKGQYIGSYLGNLKYVDDFFNYDARREIFSHIENDVTEKLIDEALASTKILEDGK